MNKLSSIFASPNIDNFQDLMRKNFKRGNKELFQISFEALETGHYEFFKVWHTDDPMNLDISPKHFSDFNIVGFDIDVFIAEFPKETSPTLILAAAGTVSDQTLQFLQMNTPEEGEDDSWVSMLTDILEKAKTEEDLQTIYESLTGNFTLYIFKDGEIFVFTSGQTLRADNRMNMSCTALSFSKIYPERTLLKIDPETEKLYPVLTV